MLRIVYTNQFRRDYKRIQKRGQEMEKLKAIITLLISGEPLPEKYKDHPLQGNFKGVRDCHIAPDWILLYVIVDDELRLIRTGSHADLFK